MEQSTYFLADTSYLDEEELLAADNVRAVFSLAAVSPGLFIAGTGGTWGSNLAIQSLMNSEQLFEPIPDYPPSWPESLKWAPIRPNAYKAIARVSGWLGENELGAGGAVVEQAARVIGSRNEETLVLLSDDRREEIFWAAAALGVLDVDLFFVLRVLEREEALTEVNGGADNNPR